MCRMACSRLGQWLTLLVCLLVLLKAESHPVALTLVQNAVAKGAGTKVSFSLLKCLYLLSFIFALFINLTCYAVCLDGSAPAYHFDKGFGAGINNWLVHIEVCVFLIMRKWILKIRMTRLEF